MFWEVVVHMNSDYNSTSDYTVYPTADWEVEVHMNSDYNSTSDYTVYPTADSPVSECSASSSEITTHSCCNTSLHLSSDVVVFEVLLSGADVSLLQSCRSKGAL